MREQDRQAPLCGAVFGSGDVTCELPPGHGNSKHKATGVDPAGGRWTIEWEDAATMRRLLGLDAGRC